MASSDNCSRRIWARYQLSYKENAKSRFHGVQEHFAPTGYTECIVCDLNPGLLLKFRLTRHNQVMKRVPLSIQTIRLFDTANGD